MNRQLVNILALACGFFLVGCIFYAWYHNYIIIRTSGYHIEATPKKYTRKPCDIQYYARASIQSDTRLCTMFDDPQLLLKELVTQWLAVMVQESHLKAARLQTACVAYNGGELILSFEKELFPSSWSTEQKMNSIYALIKTVHSFFPQAQWLHILQDYKPMADEELDFSVPWNMNLFSQEKECYNILHKAPRTVIKTIIIEPFCTKNNHGRKVYSSNERAVTMRYAYLIKKMCEFHFPHIECIVMRSDNTTELQRINQLVLAKPDLVLKLGAYEEEDQLHHLTFYHYTNTPAPQPLELNDFVDYAQAYRITIESTLYHKQHVRVLCSEHPYSRYFVFSEYACPLKALKGLSIPSCYIEIGISQTQPDKVIETLLLDTFSQLLVHS